MLSEIPPSLDAFSEDIANRAKVLNDPRLLRVELFEFVRDIPYGSIGSRDPNDVFRQRQGTCSGKHELLKHLFRAAGTEVSDIIVMHAFNDLAADYPPRIRTILESGEILDPHNVIRIHAGGQWRIVDATWDAPLAEVGFPVTRDWDGESDMALCVQERERSETDDPIASKKQMIAALPEAVRLRRKTFLEQLTIWLAEVRETGRRHAD